jgi:hypothetical protein
MTQTQYAVGETVIHIGYNGKEEPAKITAKERHGRYGYLYSILYLGSPRMIYGKMTRKDYCYSHFLKKDSMPNRTERIKAIFARAKKVNESIAKNNLKSMAVILACVTLASALEIKKVDLTAKVRAMQTVKIDLSKAVYKPTTIIAQSVK